MYKEKKISLVIPAFNEQKLIKPTYFFKVL